MRLVGEDGDPEKAIFGERMETLEMRFLGRGWRPLKCKFAGERMETIDSRVICYVFYDSESGINTC